MPVPSERSPAGGLGRVLFASLAFAAFAPVGMLALPLAGLLLASRPAARRERIALALTAAFGLWWLMLPGTIADQVVRAATLLAAATFVLATRYSRSTVTHRALLALVTTTAGLTALFVIRGWPWGAVQWWVERRTSFGARVVLGRLWATAGSGSGDRGAANLPADLERWLESGIRLLADQYAAILALQLLAGLVLATMLYHRISRAPVGLPVGRFRDFRFSEHLGWAAVVALTVVLIPKLAAAKLAAANLLVVTGAFYALRGAAVTAFGLGLLGGPGLGGTLLLGLAILFILPAMVAGAIVLGVVDAGLDLRRRWAAAANR